MATIETINPATEERVESFAAFTQQQLDATLQQARETFLHWRETDYATRRAVLHRAASYLRDHKGELGRVITVEMGKPITEAEAEVEKCAWNCDFYADHAATFLADEPVASNATESYVAFRPLGVVLAVMPWNFPFWQVFRFAAPALMAGNVGILKHASNVTRCALEIARVFREAGAPAGAF